MAATINKIELCGAQTIDYLWVTNTEMTADWEAILNQANYEPVWDINTQLLAKFNNSLNAGNAGELECNSLKGWKVYRQDLDGSTLKYVKTLEPDEVFIVDYNVKWGQEYKYYMFPDYEEAMGSPFVSKPVKACWIDWILLLCREEEGKKNEFAVEESFLFQLSTQSGQMNNNADVNIFKTYQRYPKVLKGKSNYLSGQLSSLVGYIGETNGELDYIEKIDMIDRLTSLNTDPRRKFLKDKKGHVWEVELTAPSTLEYMENLTTQPVTGGISWTEVASTEDISIYNGNARELWLLTTTGNPEYNVKYIWIDSEYWTPSKYWTEDGSPKKLTYFEEQQIDTSNATATSDDILTGKTAYGKGELIVGNLDAMLTSSEYNKLLETSKEIKGVG